MRILEFIKIFLMSFMMAASSAEVDVTTESYEEEEQEVIIAIDPDEWKAIMETPAPPKTYSKIYSIHGTIPNREWQKVLYNELNAKGIAWYMPYAVCQIWQESRWNQYADNGQDKGLTQQKAIYWYSRASRYGCPTAEIWDVNAQIHVYVCMMADYLRTAKNDVGWALSYYFYGNGQRADKYVNDVISHMKYLKEVE